MNVKQRFFRGLISAYEVGWQRRATFRHLSELERSQWLPRPELEFLQTQKLRQLLTHAFATCEYYRRDWKAKGLDPTQVESLSDFTLWPLIDRDTIFSNRNHMRSAAPHKLIVKTTGGSSGTPLEFDLDCASNDRRMAAWHRGYSWAGASLGTKQWYLWGAPLVSNSGLKRSKDTVYHWIYRRHVVNSFHMSANCIPGYLKSLALHRPDVIVAYTTPLYVLARACEEQRLTPYAPRAIVVGAEKLHSFQRETIERVFSAPVFETYGSREFMLIAAECESHQGLHVTHENLLVEILNEDGTCAEVGTEGNVAITDLTNYGMPFIRYLNGDRAIAEEGQCSCGRGLPLLRSVVGRRLDMLTDPAGRMIPGEAFVYVLKDFSGVNRYQVVQHEKDVIEVKIVCNHNWHERDKVIIQRECERVVGDIVHLKVSVVDEIQLTRSGKHRVVVNLCKESAAVNV